MSRDLTNDRGKDVWTEWLPGAGHSAVRHSVNHRLMVRVDAARKRMTPEQIRRALNVGPRAKAPTKETHND